MELFATWVLAKLLQWRRGQRCFVGFPLFDCEAKPSLEQLMYDDLVPTDLEFDSLLLQLPANVDLPGSESDSLRQLPYHRVQVKRFVSDEPTASSALLASIIATVRKYGAAPELNFVFWIKARVQLDLAGLPHALEATQLTVGSVFLAGTLPDEGRNRPIIVELHPNYTGQFWMPAEAAEA